MAHSTLTPVFIGLRTGLHLLLAALTVFAVARAFATASPAAPWVLVVALLFAALYVCGLLLARVTARLPAPRRVPYALVWVAALTAVWAVLVWLVPEGAYLVFPLFFLYLHVLPLGPGIAAVGCATGIAILALGLHGTGSGGGFTVGGVVGPLVGAGVAVLIGLAYRALAREAAEREALVAELVATQARLIATEHEQGRLAERARLAREIHDTVAQGLSSIQMLLHAAEREFARPEGAEYLRLARETAAENLAETRRFVRELTPPALEEGLGPALRRLAVAQTERTGVRIEVAVPAEPALPMELQTALLRVAQGAVSNVVRHAEASRAEIAVSVDGDDVRLSVWDDGRGFDADRALADTVAGRESFGLRAIGERVAQLGGSVDIVSAPGRGTRIEVVVPLAAAAHAGEVAGPGGAEHAGSSADEEGAR